MSRSLWGGISAGFRPTGGGFFFQRSCDADFFSTDGWTNLFFQRDSGERAISHSMDNKGTLFCKTVII